MAAAPPEPPGHRVVMHHSLPRFASYAGFVSRLMAMVVDLLVIGAVWVVGGITVDFIGRTSGLHQIVDFLTNYLNWLTPLAEFLISAAFQITILLSLGFFYFTFFYAFGGATLGKYLMGLRVVRSDGKPLRGVQAALRTLAYALSALPIYMGFISVLLDDRRRAWHDRVTRTAVVHSWNARPDETFLREAINWLNRR